ncbi:hypothetical protein J0H58_00370 [bacterium]|nr:hypothetical protein [bacterium]
MRIVPVCLLLAAAGCWKPAPDAPPAAETPPPRVNPRHGVVMTYFVGKIDGGRSCSGQAWVALDLPAAAATKTGGRCGESGGPTGEYEWKLVAHRGDADVYRVTLRYPVEGPATWTETAEVEFRGERVKVFETDAYAFVLDPATPWRP